MRTTPIHDDQRSCDVLAEALRIAGSHTFRGNACACPFHEDRHPSMSLHLDDDGIWRATCHTEGCRFSGDVFDVRKKAGLGSDRIATPKPAEKPAAVYPTLPDLLALFPACPTYRYANPDTRAVELVVIRKQRVGGGKTIIQASPTAGGWHMKAPPKPWPLYNRTKVRAAKRVLVVEGEKCVHALDAVGIVATTSPGGAGKAAYADWTPLAGKDVVLWPDNDTAGVSHMDDVARILEALNPPASVRRIDPTTLDLPPAGDVVEFIAACPVPVDGIEALCLDAGAVSPASEVFAQLEAVMEGTRITVPLPFPTLQRATRALMPGTVTVICGAPGSAKSLLAVQLVQWWTEQGHKGALYALECDRTYHLRRALAQLDGNSNLTDEDWVAGNAREVMAAWDRHRTALDTLGRCIHDSPNNAVTHAEMLAWLEKVCRAGTRVVVIDPVTAIAAEEKPWIADQVFITAARRLMVEHGASLVLVTHPKKMGKVGGLDDIAGGAAFQRFTDTIVWIDALYPPKELTTKSKMGTVPMTTNRVLKVYKARNSVGCGWEVGFDFSGDMLLFRELGLIVAEEEAS